MRRRSFDVPDYYLDGDSLLQLDDGRILSFHFRDTNDLKIYEQEEFKEILSIDLTEILKHNKKNVESF